MSEASIEVICYTIAFCVFWWAISRPGKGDK